MIHLGRWFGSLVSVQSITRDTKNDKTVTLSPYRASAEGDSCT